MYPPPASTIRSCRRDPPAFGPTAAINPSRIDTSPSTTSNASFIVRMRPLRIRREALDVAAFRLGPLHRELVGIAARHLAVLDGDQLREDAHGDFLRRDGADIEADWRMHAFEQIWRHLIGDELVVNARDLRPAADEAQVAELAGRERTQRLEIVGVPARH